MKRQRKSPHWWAGKLCVFKKFCAFGGFSKVVIILAQIIGGRKWRNPIRTVGIEPTTLEH